MASFSRTSRADSAYAVGGENAGYKETAACRIRADQSRGISLPAEAIAILPSIAVYKDEGNCKVRGWTTKLQTLLEGTRNGDKPSESSSPLVALRNHETTILREIYEHVSNELANQVKLTIPAALVGNADDRFVLNYAYGRRRTEDSTFTMPYVTDTAPYSSGFDNGIVAFCKCGQVQFPRPNGRMVTMMPFRFGDKDSLPEDLQCYFPLIEQCPYMLEEIGRVGYLTVHEIDAGKSQAQGPPQVMPPGLFTDQADVTSFKPGVEHPWGVANTFFGPDRYEGGIYCASSAAAAIEVWDALVNSKRPGVVGPNGSCEHFRDLIGSSTYLQTGELIWLTESTPMRLQPHPNNSGWRQFFRVVTPYLNRWYEGCWTPNPKVPLPENMTLVRAKPNKNVTPSSNLQPAYSWLP